MPVIYNVTIEPTGKENHFHITWHNPGTNTIDSFEQAAEITPEEAERLWQWSPHQLSIGQKLFHFLDGDARHFKRALDQAHRQGETLQVYIRTCEQTSDWPFELLAENNTFLLTHRVHLVRTVSDWGTEKKIPPKNRPLKLLFMACSALDVKPVLDYELEEEAIFRVTGKLAIDMEVEDSGSLQGLHSRLEQEQYDVVHLSGHANIDEKGKPYFVMEDETGHEHRVYPEMLWGDALIENPPRLLFLSGCRTGEKPDSPAGTDAVSFSRLLIENYNVPAVLGWGRSVGDREAIHAEKMLFHELCRGRWILEAVQRARYELLKKFPHSADPGWPLLRLFSSGIALNPIVEKGQRPMPKPNRLKHVLLGNSRVRVLAEGFVGRRRQIQASLRALEQDYYKVGVLLLGSGGLGKSCLAGKICERFIEHTLIIVHGKLDAISLAAALTDAFIMSRDETGLQILSQKTDMSKKLANLCATSFKEKNYLLLLDDFDQNLEDANKGYPGPLQLEAADLLKILLHYLPFSGKMTQMIITGRYDFSLTQQSRDLVKERLDKVWLTSFQELEQRKKGQELKNIFNYPNKELTPQLLSAGLGNPLLMEWLDLVVGQMIPGEVPQLLEAIKNKQEDFVREHVNRELLQGGGKELLRFLRCFSIYRRPVTEQGVKLVSEKTGIEDWKECLRQGISLSLVEQDQAHQTYQVTPLLREELLKSIEEAKACHEAASAYYKNVSDACDADDPVLTEEAIFHILNLNRGETEVVFEQAENLLGHLQQRLAFQGSLRGGEWSLSRKKQEIATAYYEPLFAIDAESDEGKPPGVAVILNKLGEVWSALGQPGKTIYYYRQALSIHRVIYGEEHINVAKGLANLGMVYCHLWQRDKAKDYFEKAYKIFNQLYGSEHSLTKTIIQYLKRCQLC
jgi:tetratricopeptide (TPR) repeat protein